MLHLRPSDYRVMPWKDGGGSTTEIAIEPAGASLAEPFLWRVSSARVEASGPFSHFPGRARLLTLLEGSGLILDIEGQGRLRLKHPGQVVAFAGEATVNAALIQGPCVDFGVISDPSRVRVTLEWLNLSTAATAISLAPTTLLFAPWGPVRVDPLAVELEPRDCLWLGNTPAATEAPGASLGVRATMGTTPLVLVSIWPL
ncbi:MAG: HutD family protein [Holophagaceae bacterium]|uniref:HutD family protein n=1 Tax=Candidatus Geothrix skivensis TaxID=2954439 RepID=A0A9D7SDI4_9BACT|nr:HutD family protein [Candidatus Geothrix skivensis]